MYVTAEPTYTMVCFDDDSLVLNFPRQGDVIQLMWSEKAVAWKKPMYHKMELEFVCDDYADNVSRLKEAQEYLKSENFTALEELMVDFYNSVLDSHLVSRSS